MNPDICQVFVDLKVCIEDGIKDGAYDHNDDAKILAQSTINNLVESIQGNSYLKLAPHTLKCINYYSSLQIKKLQRAMEKYSLTINEINDPIL